MSKKNALLTRQIELIQSLLESTVYDRAKKICIKTLKKFPNNPDILYYLGIANNKLDDDETAIKLIQRATQLKKNLFWEYSLATIFYNQRQFSLSEKTLNKILLADDEFSKAYFLLGEIHFLKGNYDVAETHYLKAITLNNDLVLVYHSLGLIYAKKGYLQASIAAFQYLLKFQLSDCAKANSLHALSASFLLQGKTEQALSHLSKALEIQPNSIAIHSAFLSTINYLYGFEAEKVFAHYLQFNLAHTLNLEDINSKHTNLADAERPLKIGYVSPDFRNHALINLIEPLLHNSSNQHHTTYWYFSHTENDEETQRISQCVTNWIDCSQFSDADMAKKIIHDEIDILVDLAGHTVGNRLMVFARKPAPIQITFGGYPCTTGLTAMDYRITDPYMDPPGMTEQFHSEKLIYFPSTAYFSPSPNAPDVTPLPALGSDSFTFGSFNQPYKLNDQVIELWATILNRIKNSRLILLVGETDNEVIEEEYKNKFAKYGADKDQITFISKQPMTHYLQAHQSIDLCLDTFPFNGGTTTHHSLWMGVPVVTLAGNTSCSRVGVTILSTLTLENFIAQTANEYIEICQYYAENLSELNQIRLSLRETINASSIRNEVGFINTLSECYRQVWKLWCDQQSSLKKSA